ncbi:MAG: HAMP domain-containing histidine kinase [Cellvibrio sp.]|nr:HAMP domain-containing histidine kinase [Cellvibrio sp.]
MQTQKYNPSNLVAAQLQQLTIIRSILLILLWSSVFASIWYAIELALTPIISLLSLFTLIHILTSFRLKNPLAIVKIEFFIQLLIDVLLLNLLFYFSGGATNPFVSYLLVPICISAATLSWRFTSLITFFSILGYSLLMFFYQPLAVFEMDHHSNGFNWHILGMWFNFFVSAMLITYFVVRMAEDLRAQEDLLNQMREDELRDEQLIAVATLAAGAAHEMNTPMATMKILLSELRATRVQDDALMQDITLLSQQVDLCAARLKQLVQDADVDYQFQLREKNGLEYCQHLLDLWQLMRPNLVCNKTLSNQLQQAQIHYDSRLDHAILNCLNNAADASPEKIAVDIYLEEKNIIWKITDWGSGFTQQIQSQIGKEMITTKSDGMGIGMLLTYASIKRLGGEVTHQTNQPQGTVTIIYLPIVETPS